MTSSSVTGVGAAMRAPLTRTPVRLPRSSRTNPSLARRRRAWRRETFRGVRGTWFPSPRPTVVSSAGSGAAVRTPSRSSMTSFIPSSARRAPCPIADILRARRKTVRHPPPVAILGRMSAWTEAGSQTPWTGGDTSGPTAEASVSVGGVPWLTLVLLLACVWVLAAAGGLRAGLSVTSLLSFGAKATPLILDRGETWRFFTANLLHKDLLHFAFNAFAIWNVGGPLERAVRPADYCALLLATALGTTLASAIGGDSISLGASGMAFGVLGAAAAFGWRHSLRGPLKAHFGLRLLPWLAALFAGGPGLPWGRQLGPRGRAPVRGGPRLLRFAADRPAGGLAAQARRRARVRRDR